MPAALRSLKRWPFFARIGGTVGPLLLAATAAAALLDYDEYLQRAEAAKRRGDWQSAASQFAQAINHPDLPTGGAERSLVYLEYGRAVGVLCQFDEAGKYLLRARETAEKGRSSTLAVLIDLGALSLARNKPADAVAYFSQLAPIVERESRARTSPGQLAAAYEKYAAALDATGKPDQAQLRRAEALALRQSAPASAASGAITPYGAKCPKS